MCSIPEGSTDGSGRLGSKRTCAIDAPLAEPDLVLQDRLSSGGGFFSGVIIVGASAVATRRLGSSFASVFGAIIICVLAGPTRRLGCNCISTVGVIAIRAAVGPTRRLCCTSAIGANEADAGLGL